MHQLTHTARQSALLMVLFLCATQAYGQAIAPRLFDLGDHSYSISTQVPEAQIFFNQGLILAYAFNHAEAVRSFQEAQRLDPDCAMCFWGEALVLGPNINAAMDPADVPQAYAAIQRAKELSSSVSAKEQDFINALATRYQAEAESDRTALDLERTQGAPVAHAEHGTRKIHRQRRQYPGAYSTLVTPWLPAPGEQIL